MSLNWIINNQQAKKYEFKELIPNSAFPDILIQKKTHMFQLYRRNAHVKKNCLILIIKDLFPWEWGLHCYE